MPRISSKNQVTVPVSALSLVGLRAGDEIVVEPVGEGELRLRRATLDFDSAFGALSGTYDAGYLDRLDAEDDER